MSDATVSGRELPAGEGGQLARREEAALSVGEHTGEHAHPTTFQYVMIALILCVITAFEVAVSYLEGDVADWLIVTVLLVMAIAKFAIVAGYYMHLKPDKPIFRRFFVLGIGAAIVLYLVVLLSLHGVY